MTSGTGRSRFMLWLRRLKIGWIRTTNPVLGPLRRRFMREAAGLALGPMPALLEGRRP